ncbi:MAG: hypothetical protein ACI9EK_002950 [Psychroserpens sp.]|jgi:hypothetical protein
MDNSKYFDRVTEIDKAIAEHQQAIQRCLRNEITLEECSKYQKAVFNSCNEYRRIEKKPD